MSLFDRADEYEAMLHSGLKLSGESKAYFERQRVKVFKEWVGDGPRRILDFGCGVGSTTKMLSEEFPEASIVGVDTAERALQRARADYAGERVSFVLPFEVLGRFDACYVNCAFHHIAPTLQPEAINQLGSLLVPGGRIGIFENNPWSLPARLVMRRIPFDRDATMVSARRMRKLLAGAEIAVRVIEYHFVFPAVLRRLRPLESRMVRLPLGAQYAVLGERLGQLTVDL